MLVITLNSLTAASGGLDIAFLGLAQADAEGNFSFTFVPQIAIPGARYDIAMVASRGNASQETRLSLFER